MVQTRTAIHLPVCDEADYAVASEGGATPVRTWDWAYLPSSGVWEFSDAFLSGLGYVGDTPAADASAAPQLIHAADCRYVLKNIQHAVADKFNFFATVRLRQANGAYRWFEMRAERPRRCTDPAVSMSSNRIAGCLRDVHDSHTHRLAHRREAERAILAIECSEMGTWEAFPDGSAAWDEQTYRLYGHSPDTQILPQDIYRHAVGETGFVHTGNWLAKAFTEGLTAAIEFQISWPNGDVHWLAAKGRQLLDDHGRTISLLGINWDITGQRRAREVLRKHQDELSRLTRQLMQRERETSSKLAMVLHDRLGQTLAAMRLTLDAHPDKGNGPCHPLRRLDTLVNDAVDDVRNLLDDLRPTLLEVQGLGAALDNEVGRMNGLGQPTEIIFMASADAMKTRWPEDVAYAFFMIARESLSNAMCHAHARLVQVDLAATEQGLMLAVVDDGEGFGVDAHSSKPGHLGMISMRERADAIKARLKVTSSRQEGTRVTLIWSPGP